MIVIYLFEVHYKVNVGETVYYEGEEKEHYTKKLEEKVLNLENNREV